MCLRLCLKEKTTDDDAATPDSEPFFHSIAGTLDYLNTRVRTLKLQISSHKTQQAEANFHAMYFAKQNDPAQVRFYITSKYDIEKLITRDLGKCRNFETIIDQIKCACIQYEEAHHLKASSISLNELVSQTPNLESIMDSIHESIAINQENSDLLSETQLKKMDNDNINAEINSLIENSQKQQQQQQVAPSPTPASQKQSKKKLVYQ